MTWAKLHTDILGDPKLMRAARKGAKGLQLTPWMIAFAKSADDEGRLTVGGEAAEPTDVTGLIPGATTRAVADCWASLLAIGILARDPDGALRFTAWDRRSGARSSDPPERIRERVRQFRQRQRNGSEGDGVTGEVTAGVTGPVTDSVTDVTLLEKRREEQSRTEKSRTTSPAPGGARKLTPTVVETAVLEHYRDRHPRAKPNGDKIIRTIRRALLTYSAEELCQAIDGNAWDPWHRDNAKHELTYVLRDSETIDKFVELQHRASDPNRPPNGARGGVAKRTFENAMRALEHEP